MSEPNATGSPERRGLLKKLAAVVIGGIVSLVAPVAGLFVFFDPLRKRHRKGGDFIRVISLDTLPADGTPRRFTLVADRIDAWNKYTNVFIGAVFLRRTSEAEIEAFNVSCPHLGCTIDHRGEDFFCPCHDSSFALDGSISGPKSSSPRDMDALQVEVREGVVWVKFQNFRTGTEQPIPIS
ncbi:MAG: Rieske (2Fe-2S) protein [Planctomycetota bacterium]|jgi:menaquinol-cytochrome c reductase iron-sulfur subunit|nr:Rieske (2Fe-2S) protein [Planctomycetota bacterium]MDP7130078.1 Rieske (2Fe-2S) protein [Planctomycetota bacterium]